MAAGPTPLRRLLAFVRPHRGRVFFALLAAGLTAAATAAYAYLVGPLLTALLTGEAVEVRGVRIDRAVLAWQLPALLLGVAAVKALAQWVQSGLLQEVAQRVMQQVRREVYARLLELPPQELEQRRSGDLLARLTSDVAQLEFAVAQALVSYAKDGLHVVALLALCAFIDWRLFALAFGVIPAAAVPVSRFARSVKKVAVGSQASLGALTALAAEQLQHLPVVQAYGAEPRALRGFEAEQGRYLRAMERSLLLRGAFTPTLELLGFAGTAVALGLGAAAVANEPALAAKLGTFLAATLLLYQPLKSISGTFSLVQQGLASADRLFELFDRPPREEAGAAAGPLRHSLELREVEVVYPDGRRAVRGVSFTVPAGKRVALVGPSGAGKSTLFSTVLGFTPLSGGEVRWDGTPLRSLSEASVRAQLAWVQQEPVLFSGSVRQNLLLAQPSAADDALWDALRAAHADGFVRALPEGLEAQVGERGGRLSGGQRQRLALARAFLRRPSLLLLDEPTSALDAESEREVEAGLKSLLEGRTALVIAHRLSTVRAADWVVVLEHGAVAEEGPPEALLARDGAFSRLWAAGNALLAG